MSKELINVCVCVCHWMIEQEKLTILRKKREMLEEYREKVMYGKKQEKQEIFKHEIATMNQQLQEKYQMKQSEKHYNRAIKHVK